MAKYDFPELPLASWKETRDTIHKYSQVLGEIRGSLAPRSKQWWHINLRPGITGCVTPPIATNQKTGPNSIQMGLDFNSHNVTLQTSASEQIQFDMTSQSVAAFREQIVEHLKSIGVVITLADDVFSDRSPLYYDAKLVKLFWKASSQIALVFDEFKAGMRNETSPVNLWPHHFDMSLVWFSGRLVPGAEPADADYADEQLSFGFSTGDDGIPDPYFYFSAYPLPAGMEDISLPLGVKWETNAFTGALLMYESLVSDTDAKARLLNVMKTWQESGAVLMK